MVPLRMLSFLLVMLSVKDTSSTCTPEFNPLVLEPPEVRAQYGHELSINCSSNLENDYDIYWIVGDETIETEDGYSVVYNLSLSDWNMTAQCKIKLNDSFECTKDLEITVFSDPEVLFSVKNIKAEDNATLYELQLDAIGVAPVEKFSVWWLKNDEIVEVHNMSKFNSTTKTPVNVSSILSVNVTRKENVVQIGWRTVLDPPTFAHFFNISAHYAPELLFHKQQSYIDKGDNVTLECDAEANPPPTFSWSCDGINMSRSSNQLTLAPVNVNTICICTATNYLGNITIEFDVQVKETVIMIPTIPSAPGSPIPRDCPLTLVPPEIVVRFGDSASATCSTSDPDVTGMDWVATDGERALVNSTNLTWVVEKLENWNPEAFCTANLTDGSKCSVPLNIILYNIPLVSFSIVDMKAGDDVTVYKLQLDAIGVAPVEKFSVVWFKNDEELKTSEFNSTAKTPVRVSSILSVNVTRRECEAQIRWVAQLDFEQDRDLNYRHTSSFNISAHYAPELNSSNSGLLFTSESDNVTLECDVVAYPPPTFSWSCNGINMLHSSNQLTLAPANVDTICICTATNYLGNVTKEYYIWEKEQPATMIPTIPATPGAPIPRDCPLTLVPPELVVRFGDSASATCSTSDPDVTRIDWVAKVGKKALVNSTNLTWVAEKLENWNPEAFCIANLTDGSQCSVPLNIILYKTPDSVSVYGPPAPMIEDNEYTLKCKIIDVVPAKNLSIIWYRDEETVHTDSITDTSGIPMNVLSRMNIKAERHHNGLLYSCSAQLLFGPSGPELPPTAVSLPFTAIVHYKPVIQHCPSQHNVLENSSNMDMIDCEGDGNPSPVVQWFHKDKLVNSSRRLGRNDSGEYFVVFENAVGKANTSINVTVEYAPSFNCDAYYEVEVNVDIQTKCQPEGIPPPVLDWYRNDKKVDPRAKHESGKYILLASNKHGNKEHTAYFDILYAPHFSEGNVQKEVTEGENVTLDCNAEGNPPPEIYWRVLSSENEATEWRQKTITVRGATSTTAGVYSCHATNKVGNVTRSVTLLIKGKTDGIPHAVIWGFLVLLLILILLLLVIFCRKRQKKQGQYDFIPDKSGSDIPLSSRSTEG